MNPKKKREDSDRGIKIMRDALLCAAIYSTFRFCGEKFFDFERKLFLLRVFFRYFDEKNEIVL